MVKSVTIFKEGHYIGKLTFVLKGQEMLPLLVLNILLYRSTHKQSRFNFKFALPINELNADETAQFDSHAGEGGVMCPFIQFPYPLKTRTPAIRQMFKL